jgi:hypothetical protein
MGLPGKSDRLEECCFPAPDSIPESIVPGGGLNQDGNSFIVEKAARGRSRVS